MNPAWLGNHVIGPIAMVGGLVLGFWIAGRRSPPSPRRLRWTAWLSLIPSGVVLALLAVSLSKRGLSWPPPLVLCVTVPLILISGLAATYSLLRRPTSDDALANFAADRQLCGRCEYDLTGNVSGVCPECGWVIPRGELDVDSPGWAIWWKQWKIPHLKDWRRTRRFLIVMTLAFAAMAVVGIYTGGPAMATLMAVMATQMGINAYRVNIYGRNSSAKHSPDEET